jgi:hypothetical protein
MFEGWLLVNVGEDELMDIDGKLGKNLRLLFSIKFN